jgi:hypothetical protein
MQEKKIHTSPKKQEQKKNNSKGWRLKEKKITRGRGKEKKNSSLSK